MFPRLLLLFTIVPFIELALLVYISQFIGILQTIGLVIVTGILGAALTRREGLRCWKKIQEKLAAGKAPTAELIEGPMILLAGAFLITPGILTDLSGLLLLLPMVRKRIARRLADHFRSRLTFYSPGHGASGFTTWTSGSEIEDEDVRPGRSGDEIIDVTFTDADSEKNTKS